MNDKLPVPIHRCAGWVRSVFYLLDEPTTTLTIQSNGQTITAHASGQIAQDLRALSRGATNYATLHHASPDCPEIIAFSVVSDDDDKHDPNARGGDG